MRSSRLTGNLATGTNKTWVAVLIFIFGTTAVAQGDLDLVRRVSENYHDLRSLEFFGYLSIGFQPKGEAVARGKASRASSHSGRRGQVPCRSPRAARICGSNSVRHRASARRVFPASLGSNHLAERETRNTACYSRQDSFCTSSSPNDSASEEHPRNPLGECRGAFGRMGVGCAYKKWPYGIFEPQEAAQTGIPDPGGASPKEQPETVP